MVSMALMNLTERTKKRLRERERAAAQKEEVASLVTMADTLLKEAEWCGCRIILKNGRPVIEGNTSQLDSETLALIKENRLLIIERLAEQEQHRPATEEDSEATAEALAARFYAPIVKDRSDNRLTGDGPCSVCGCQEWYKRADDYDPPEGWACMICHPCPQGVRATLRTEQLISSDNDNNVA